MMILKLVSVLLLSKDKASGKSVDIVVTQGEKGSVLTFSTENQNGTDLVIDNEKQEITAEVSVKSNYDYSISISPDWLTYEKKGAMMMAQSNMFSCRS